MRRGRKFTVTPPCPRCRGHLQGDHLCSTAFHDEAFVVGIQVEKAMNVRPLRDRVLAVSQGNGCGPIKVATGPMWLLSAW